MWTRNANLCAGSFRDKMKLRVPHIIVVILILLCLPLFMGADFMYWSGNFSPIALGNIGNRDQVCQGSSQVTLFTSGDAEISADNTDAARLAEPGGDSLYTEYKLEFDGDGVSKTGGSTVDFTGYDLFLSSPATVTHIPDDNDVQVTLYVRASNYTGQMADAGNYSATQTLTVYWIGP
jgi:hypothetical protein